MEAWDRRDPEGSEAYEGPALPQSAGRPWIGLVSLYIASTPCQMGGLPAPLPFRWGFSSSPSPPRPGFGGVSATAAKACAATGVSQATAAPPRGAPPGGARAPARPANGQRPPPTAGARGGRGARGRCHRGNCPGFLGRGRPPPYFPVYCTSNS